MLRTFQAWRQGNPVSFQPRSQIRRSCKKECNRFCRVNPTRIRKLRDMLVVSELVKVREDNCKLMNCTEPILSEIKFKGLYTIRLRKCVSLVFVSQ